MTEGNTSISFTDQELKALHTIVSQFKINVTIEDLLKVASKEETTPLVSILQKLSEAVVNRQKEINTFEK